MDEMIANTYFLRILPGRENCEVLNEALEIQQFGDEVIERLRWLEENDPGIFWWEDKPLMSLFDCLYISGCIILPKNPTERLRWIALLCIEFSKIYEYSCGNVVIPPDFLPDELLETWEEVYGIDVIETVIKIRKALTEKGWEGVFCSRNI